MDQPAFFQPGNDFRLPTRRGLYPFSKDFTVIGVTERAGGDNPRAIHGVALDRPMEAAQHFERARHGLGIEGAAANDASPHPGNLAVLMSRVQSPATHLPTTQPYRV